MKKLDKLILKSFLGPFFLTLIVILFIFLSRQMLYYFDDVIGKGLDPDVLFKLLVYLTMLMIPAALPLAVLLSSLITFGNLAEHFELSAIKSAGISPLRVLRPIFLFVLIVSCVAFMANNNLAPKAALQTYSLLYDIRQKKPALDIREGIFYTGFPDMTIKVNKKFTDDEAALKEVMFYDHRNGVNEVTIADSGRMSLVLDGRFLKFELFNGYNYSADASAELSVAGQSNGISSTMKKMVFAKSEMIFDLSSFELIHTNTALFEGSRFMRNLSQLSTDINSLDKKCDQVLLPNDAPHFFMESSDKVWPSRLKEFSNALVTEPTFSEIQQATNKARATTVKIQQAIDTRDNYRSARKEFQVQWHRILSNAFACITMFLIGAPLGSIIKKGGLGVPFLVSICCFIVFTVIGMQGEDLATQGIVAVPVACWLSNGIGMLAGVMFLRMSYQDRNFLEADWPNVRSRIRTFLK